MKLINFGPGYNIIENRLLSTSAHAAVLIAFAEGGPEVERKGLYLSELPITADMSRLTMRLSLTTKVLTNG